MSVTIPDIEGANSVLTHDLVEGVLRLDIPNRILTRNGEKVALDIREFCALAILMQNPVIVLPDELLEATDELQKRLYGYEDNKTKPVHDQDWKTAIGVGKVFARMSKGVSYVDSGHTVRIIISHLRKALGEPNIIGTYIGGGYRLDDEETVNHPNNLRSRPSRYMLQYANIEMNLLSHAVSIGGKNVHLEPILFAYLAAVILNHDKALTTAELYAIAKGPVTDQSKNPSGVAQKQIDRIRSFLQNSRAKIETVRPRKFRIAGGLIEAKKCATVIGNDDMSLDLLSLILRRDDQVIHLGWKEARVVIGMLTNPDAPVSASSATVHVINKKTEPHPLIVRASVVTAPSRTARYMLAPKPVAPRINRAQTSLKPSLDLSPAA